jgi:uncharacterized iron-regulated protein
LALHGVIPAKAGIHAFLAALAFLAPGCASGPPAEGLEGRLWDVRAERFISEEELIERLRAARYRLLGEVHDHPAHHTLRAGLLAKLAPAEVFFEQFDREHDGALREAQRASADADALAKAGGLDKAWRWPLHRPLVATALAAQMPVRAANLSTADARRIAKAGALGAEDAPLMEVLARAEWSEARDRAMRSAIIDSHCGMLPERAAPGMALAQRARDAAIAQVLAGSGGPAVLIAGNGHVRRDLGVPLYLPTDATVMSVGFLETKPGESDPRTYAVGAGGMAAYDYVWFTAPHQRPDPCNGMHNRTA